MSWTRLSAVALWAVYLAAIATHPDGAVIATGPIRHGALVAAGLLVLVAAVAASGGIDWRRPSWPSGWSFLIAVVPILLLLRSPPAALDHRAALGRSAAPTAPAPATPAEPVAEGGEVRLDRLTGVQGRVRIIAMAVQPVGRLAYLLPASRERLPDPMVLLRFRMICCAADSMPVAVQVSGIPSAEVADGTWIEVECTIGTLGGEPLVQAISWKEVKEPEEPYLTGTTLLGK